jgi:hypothetical protein
LKFSNKSLVKLANLLAQQHAHADLSTKFFEYELTAGDPGTTINKPAHALALLRAVQKEKNPQEAWQVTIELAETVGSLAASLRLDGLEYVDGKLIATTPAPAALAPLVSAFEQALAARGLTLAVHHYRQATDNFTDGNFEAANSQVRSFVEALLPALSTQATKHAADTPGAALQHLKDCSKN